MDTGRRPDLAKAREMGPSSGRARGVAFVACTECLESVRFGKAATLHLSTSLKVGSQAAAERLQCPVLSPVSLSGSESF